MRIDPNVVCTIEHRERQDFTDPPDQKMGFVEHPKYGALIVNYEQEDPGGDEHFVHFLEKNAGQIAAWLHLPSDTRELVLTKMSFRYVTT